MADRSAPTPDELGFAGCLAELDRIVTGLESDTVDVDEMTATVERATELVQWCRSRLGSTRLRVEELLERLDDEQGDGDGEDGPEGDGAATAEQ